MATRRHHRFLNKLSSLVLSFHLLAAFSLAQKNPGDPDYNIFVDNACVANLGYLACMGNSPGANIAPRLYWAAIAVSPATLSVGAAHGRDSQSEAQQTALQNCRRNGARDCKVLSSAGNQCVALALSHPDGAFGYDGGLNRIVAGQYALAQCRRVGGQNCAVITTPCGGDDVRWSAPLPFPEGVAGGKVDPAFVGTWIMDRNPGIWIWRIAANGTYEFHSEAMDNAPSNNGTLTASGGHYTLHAISMAWDDVGTCVLQGRDSILANGKLGTGLWKRAR